METLRQRAYEAIHKESSLLYGSAELVAGSPAVDATEAVSYFLEQTPEESAFSVADVPLEAAVKWLKTGTRMAFFECSAPPESGLAWGTLLGRDVDQEHLKQSISWAGLSKGVDTEVEAGDPGLALMDAGLVSRAGVFVYLDDPLGDEGRARYYGHLFGERVELDELGGVLQLICFVEIGSDGGGLTESGDGSSLIEPSLVWYLPLGEDGYIVELGGGADEIMMVAPGVGDLAAFEDVMDDLADAQRPLLLAVLFSLACVGATRNPGAQSPELQRAGQDAVGPVEALRMTGMFTLLDGRGNARDLGLSHALTVCRAEFEARG